MSVIVYAPGCWDLLHVGHIRFLSASKSLGDKLIVGVPSDSVVEEDKGELPIIPELERVEMVNNLKSVDLAVLYHRLEFLTHLRWFNPNVLTVGEFWGTAERHREAELFMAEHDGRVTRLPYFHGQSTSAIKDKIKGAN